MKLILDGMDAVDMLVAAYPGARIRDDSKKFFAEIFDEYPIQRVEDSIVKLLAECDRFPTVRDIKAVLDSHTSTKSTAGRPDCPQCRGVGFVDGTEITRPSGNGNLRYGTVKPCSCRPWSSKVRAPKPGWLEDGEEPPF